MTVRELIDELERVINEHGIPDGAKVMNDATDTEIMSVYVSSFAGDIYLSNHEEDDE